MAEGRKTELDDICQLCLADGVHNLQDKEAREFLTQNFMSAEDISSLFLTEEEVVNNGG